MRYVEHFANPPRRRRSDFLRRHQLIGVDMTGKEHLMPDGEKLRMAVRWICEVIQHQPEKKRTEIIREAEIRFDLTPKECLFLDTKIDKPDCGQENGSSCS